MGQPSLFYLDFSMGVLLDPLWIVAVYLGYSAHSTNDGADRTGCADNR